MWQSRLVFIGMTLSEVRYEMRDKKEVEIRVIREDEKRQVLTQDYNPFRINLELENGQVANVTWG